MRFKNTTRAAAVAMAISLVTACSFLNAAPSECISAAEDAGLSDGVINQLREPDGLNAFERAALQRVITQSSLDDVCKIPADGAQRADDTNDQGIPTRQPTSPVRKEDGGSASKANGTRNEKADASASGRPANGQITEDEDRRRCRFWALNNLEPVVYNEFTKLDPDTMDDLDRILWSSHLNSPNSKWYYPEPKPGEKNHLIINRLPAKYCRDYWAEPLGRQNAELRNYWLEGECRLQLEKGIKEQYRRLAGRVQHDGGNELAYSTPNQYVRILQWLDLSGQELMESELPQYRILEEQSNHPYAYWREPYTTTEGLADYAATYENKYGATLDIEWLSIIRWAGLKDHSDSWGEPCPVACHQYYPQLFYGYWIPLEREEAPAYSNQDDAELPRYDDASTPLYLPEKVEATRIKLGYPIGMTTEGYWTCEYQGELNDIGYYYVKHPASDYCEKKP